MTTRKWSICMLSLLLQALLSLAGSNFCSQPYQESDVLNCSDSYIDSFQAIDFSCPTINIYFMVDYVALNENVTISDVRTIALQGNNNFTRVDCSRGSGLKFTNVCNLDITLMQFSNCGVHTYYTSGSQSRLYIYYAIFISDSYNVTLRDSSITDSHGIGLILINNYNVHMDNCVFRRNKINSSFLHSEFSGKAFGGGGGVYIESSRLQCNQNSIYTITSCDFLDNHATIQNAGGNSSNTIITGVGNGGGLEIWVYHSSGHHIDITDSVFQNNSASWGGGLQIVMSHGATNNSVCVSDSIIDSNAVFVNQGGGGVDIGYIGGNVKLNSIKFKSVNITNNFALFGGGSALFTFNTLAFDTLENSIEWFNCLWARNVAHYGAAINISPQQSFANYKEHMWTFEDCTFESNFIVTNMTSSDKVSQNGVGILMITNGIISFQGENNFVNNNSTCVYAVSSTLYFLKNSNTLFSGNSGNHGAGMSLNGFSLIVVAESINITFCNNFVFGKGGVIYYYSIDKIAYAYSRTCFIQKLNPTQSCEHVYFNFFGNKALSKPVYINSGNVTSNSIYGTSLQSCLYSHDTNVQYEFMKVGNFRQSNVCESCMLQTDRKQADGLCQYEYGLPQISTMEKNLTFNFSEEHFMFVPGEKFNLPLKVNGNKIDAIYTVTIENHNNSEVTIPEDFSVVSKHKLILYGNPGDTATLTLTELGFRKYSIAFKVQARDCPPLLTIKNKMCVCYLGEDLIFVEFLKCSRRRTSVRMGYWIDYMKADQNTECMQNLSDRYTLLTSYCPLGYCSQNVSENNYYSGLTAEVLSLDSLDKVICENRHETLCGLCDDNSSVYFHSESFKCGKTDLCYLGPLFYLLSEILPLTLLFLFVIFFNISFTSGNLNGFIFFAQMYDTISKVGGSFIPLSLQYSKISFFHRLIYKTFNFDFFDDNRLSFCLFETQGTLNILLVKYVTVGYALVLVLGTIWIIKCCSKFRCLHLRKAKYSVIQGLAAFLVMVYSQCTYVSLAILNKITIYRGAKKYKEVVFLQGNIEYFSTEHLPYALSALFCILSFVTLLPLLLITYPLCNKIIALLSLEENRIIKFTSKLIPITKIKPLLDCFQGTFKDKYRFFAGLYFVYRVTILSSRFANGVILIFTIIEVQLIAMLALHTITWPYRKKIHNVVDLLVFADLAIINSLKLLNFLYAENGVKSKTKIHIIHWIQLFFIYIPLVGLCLRVLYLPASKLLGKGAKHIFRIYNKTENRYTDGCDNDDDFLENYRRSFLTSDENEGRNLNIPLT